MLRTEFRCTACRCRYAVVFAGVIPAPDERCHFCRHEYGSHVSTTTVHAEEPSPFDPPVVA